MGAELIARIFVVLLLAGLPGGCLPPVWDAFDAINQVDKVEPGVTTKIEVIEILGEPSVVVGNKLRYSGSKSDGAMGGCAGRLINEKPWHIEVRLNANDVVQSVKIRDYTCLRCTD